MQILDPELTQQLHRHEFTNSITEGSRKYDLRAAHLKQEILNTSNSYKRHIMFNNVSEGKTFSLARVMKHKKQPAHSTFH